MSIQAQAGARPASVKATRRHARLRSSSAIGALAISIYFSPLMVDEAQAACTNNGGSPDIIVCDSDADGIQAAITDTNGATLNVDPGAVITRPAGTVIDVDINGGFASNRDFNFNMPS